MKITPKGMAVVALMDAHARTLGIDPHGLSRPERARDLQRVIASMKTDPTYTLLCDTSVERGGVS